MRNKYLKVTNGFNRNKDIQKYIWTQDTRKLRAINYYLISESESELKGRQNVDPINYLH